VTAARRIVIPHRIHSPSSRVLQGIGLASARPVSERATTYAAPVGATRTDLALARSAMAAERTLMAWIRTSLAMISFGFTLGKVGDAVRVARVELMFGRTADVAGVAYYLVTLGTLALILAAVQYRIELASLGIRSLKRRSSLAFVIAVLLSLLGGFALIDLVTAL